MDNTDMLGWTKKSRVLCQRTLYLRLLFHLSCMEFLETLRAVIDIRKPIVPVVPFNELKVAWILTGVCVQDSKGPKPRCKVNQHVLLLLGGKVCTAEGGNIYMGRRCNVEISRTLMNVGCIARESCNLAALFPLTSNRCCLQ